MRGQDPSKRGDWYEEDFVVLQLLRLLDEEVESVQWERVHDDGEGIDCTVTESGARIAVQCKVRETGHWTLDTLGSARSHGRSVLGYAKTELESDLSTEYRFVSDAPCPELKRLIETATLYDDPTMFSEDKRTGALGKLMRHWELSQKEATECAIAYSLLRRISVRTADESFIKSHTKTLSRALAPTADRSLVDAVRELARANLEVELRAPDVAAAVQQEKIELQPRANEPRIRDRLDDLADGFLQDLAETRVIETIHREETEEVLSKIQNASPGVSILVHGPAGSGKSEVIAAVVESLRQEHTPVLTLRPDLQSSEIGLGDDPVVSLLRYAAGGSAAVVIDQLDQALTSGEKVQRRLRRCRGWLRQAQRSGFHVVVGCRTVDAEKDERLSSLLTGPSDEKPETVLVGDFDEPMVSKVLASRGIALDDLSQQTRTLARRPIWLRMMVGLVDADGKLDNLRSEIEIVDRWWSELSRKRLSCTTEQAEATLDDLIDRMERDGRFSASIEGLDRLVVEELCSAGILARYPRNDTDHVRPIHQIVTDSRLAQRWSNVRTLDDLVKHLGPFDSQSLHQARRLRLSVPLFVGRSGGISLLSEILRSLAVRPLLKRAVLLGVAAVDHPSTDLADAVRAWIEDKGLRTHVLDTAVLGNLPIIEKLSERGWIDDAWTRSVTDEALRERLIGILGSVSFDWGQSVARHLAKWARDDPAVLDQVHRVLTHQPGDDTDALFALRKEHIARHVEAGQAIDWKDLWNRNPHRVFELLAILLERTPPEDLVTGWPSWAVGLKHPELPLEPGSLGSGGNWNHLLTWWHSLPEDLLQRFRWEIDRDSFLPFVVDLMALSLASQVGKKPDVWGDVSDSILRKPRDLDGWLLLRAGALLPADASKAADILGSWFRSEPGWTQLRVGRRGSSSDLQLARQFVAGIGDTLSEDEFQQLERWLREYRDRWTAPMEKERHRQMPSSHGLTAYRLFTGLPAERLSGSSLRTLTELRRKFDGKLYEGIGEPRGGHITSVVPDHVADRWSISEWQRQLATVISRTGSNIPADWHELGDGSFGEFTLGQLASQLQRLAAAEPRRYAGLARAFDATTHPSARKAVLAGIAQHEQPDHYARPSPWEGLEDDELAEVLIRPEYLDEPELDRRLAWIIDKRPSFKWPDQVIERLREIAKGPASDKMFLTGDSGLLGYRMNDTACSATHALGEVAKHRPSRRPQVLDLAQSLVEHEDPGRRASGASAAVSCYEYDPHAVVAALFRATLEPGIAAEHDLMRSLIWLASQSDDPETRSGALTRVLAIAADTDAQTAERGGRAAVALRMQGAFSDKHLDKVLQHGTYTRRGAAREIYWLLRDDHSQDWLLELVLRLADDADQKTGESVVHGIADGPTDRWVRNHGLFSRLLSTKAGKRHIRSLIEGCDRAAHILPVADQVIELALQAAQPADDNVEHWRRYEATRGAVNALARLVEEAEEESSFDIRERALDAWDTLIEAGEPVAAHAFDKRMIDS